MEKISVYFIGDCPHTERKHRGEGERITIELLCNVIDELIGEIKKLRELK